MKTGGEPEALERLLLHEALADEREHRHLSRRPVDQVLTLWREAQVFDVVAFCADFQERSISNEAASINELTDDFDARQPPSSAQVRELDQDMDADHLTAQLADQLDRGAGGAPGGEHIIHDQHLLTGADRVLMDLELIGSVLELIVLADCL